jgi:hypothetical protein
MVTNMIHHKSSIGGILLEYGENFAAATLKSRCACCGCIKGFCFFPDYREIACGTSKAFMFGFSVFANNILNVWVCDGSSTLCNFFGSFQYIAGYKVR